MSGLGQGYAFTGRVVAQDRGRAAQRERLRQGARRGRQAQDRFDLCGEFVGEKQRPAAAEWPARFFARRALRLPGGIECSQEIACDDFVVLAIHASVGVQRERVAIGRQQEIPATLRRSGRERRRRRLQQHRIARRRVPVQRQQVYVRWQGAGDEHVLQP